MTETFPDLTPPTDQGTLLWQRVALRGRYEARADEFARAQAALPNLTDQRSFESGFFLGFQRALSFLKQEVDAWPEGTERYRALPPTVVMPRW